MNTIIKSHGRTGEGISAPVFAGRGEGGSHGVDLSDGAMARIGKAANRSAWPVKFLPKPLECCHVVHSPLPTSAQPQADDHADRDAEEGPEGEEGHTSTCVRLARNWIGFR